MTDTITITQPDDWHLHVRDGAILAAVIGDTARRFGRALIMPNLKPPVTTVAMAREYRDQILAVVPDGLELDPVMSLYLTDNTAISEVDAAASDPHVAAFKLYPAGATTNSNHGVSRMANVMPVLERMAERGVILQIHGEVTDSHVDIFDREAAFIDQVLLPLIKELPELRVIFEHITTKQAVEFVMEGNADTLAATITPQHLLYSRNVIFQGGIQPHYYCLPILKREIHQQALQQAATSGNSRFFLGTDSAPHRKTDKESACGCAGCYSAINAIELYAEVFDSLDKLPMLEGFASFFGADYYGLPRNEQQISLRRSTWITPQEVAIENDAHSIVPFDAGVERQWQLL